MNAPNSALATQEYSELRALTGSEKAAAFMLALGEDFGRPIWEQLADDEIKELSTAMATLGSVKAGIMEKLMVQFATEVASVGSLHGSYDSTERLLGNVLPGDRVQQIMDEIRGPAGRTMWDKLGNVNEQVLATYLKHEYPQTVAVVLQKIRGDHAARVLSALPEDFAMEVVMRMLRMEAVQKDVLEKVEKTLRIEFMSNLARTSRRDSHETIADIFNHLDRSTEDRFLAALEERNRDSAEKIRSLMFTFEDLGKLDPSGVQTLLRNIEKDKLGLALKGASDRLKDLFFTNMSERAAKILRDDMQAMGPVRLRDVDTAQAAMVSVAKDLADSGEIILADSKGEDELVY